MRRVIREAAGCVRLEESTWPNRVDGEVTSVKG
jgi:hypothetical protein